MEWPSERVAPGGLFHPAKVQYSKETHDLIKLLMEEAKLTMMHRKTINYHLRNGEPLPLPELKIPTPEDDRLFALEIMRKARISRKKTFETIKESGAFEIPKYVPLPNSREPTEKAKIRLQEVMYGAKLSPVSQDRRKRKSREQKNSRMEPKDRIVDLMNQITERADWLAEMEDLGEGKQHRNIIQSQIAERLREIKILEKIVNNENGSSSGSSEST